MKVILLSIIVLQAALIKSCANIDKAILKDGAVIERNVLKNEKELLTKDGRKFAQELILTKTEVESIKKNYLVYSDLKKSKKIAKEFYLKKQKLIDEIVDQGLSFIQDKQNTEPRNNNPFLNKVVKEIVDGPNGIILKKQIIHDLRNDRFNKENLRTLLNGGKFDTLSFKPPKLFAIYFIYSDLFADRTLQDIAKSVHCDKGKLEEIKLIADRRKIRKNSVLYNQIYKCQ